MHEEKGRTRAGMVSVALAAGSLPEVAWAFENAPGANIFGLLVVAVLLAAGVAGAWVSLREQRDSRRARNAPPSDRRVA